MYQNVAFLPLQFIFLSPFKTSVSVFNFGISAWLSVIQKITKQQIIFPFPQQQARAPLNPRSHCHDLELRVV